MKPIKLLLIDSTTSTDYKLLEKQLKSIPNLKFKLSLASSVEVAKEAFLAANFDIYLIQEKQEVGNGVELLKFARKNGLDKPLIILTSLANRQEDLAAMLEGADDYIVESKMSAENIERSVRYSYERYKSRLRVEQRESRYRNLFERSINAIAITDKQLMITESNQALVQLLKQPRENLQDNCIGKYFIEKESYLKFEEKVFKQGLVKSFEADLLRSDEQKLFCEITTVAMFDLEHKVNGYQLIINDLSEIKKHEQRVLRAEKLGMTGRIARGIAHEVRNPLTNINLAMDHIKEELKDYKELDTYISIIERSSERINNLIGDLLSSSKPSALDIKDNSINSLLEETAKLAADRIRLKGIKLVRDYGEEMKIPFDFHNLKNAMLNIIINAIEAVDEKGMLTIKKTVSMDEVHIEISDNGKGIDQDTLKKMFDPFFTGKHNGMGLGLTTTQNIVQQHAGSIDIESEVDEGTTFIISLPKK